MASSSASSLSRELQCLKQREKKFYEERSRITPNANPTIYRVDPLLRKQKKEHFDTSVIPLGLFGRRTYDHFKDEDAARGMRIQLKRDVVITFFKDMRRNLDAWVSVSQEVVAAADLPKMRGLYDKYWDLNFGDEETSSALTLDAIFVTCFLSSVHEKYRSDRVKDFVREYLKNTFNLLSHESESSILSILQDILKLENQIPLQAIRNVTKIMSQRCTTADEPVTGDDILHAICETFVWIYAWIFPCLDYSTSGTASNHGGQSQTLIESAIMRETTAAGSDASSCNHDHLLHYLADKIWSKARLPNGNVDNQIRGHRGCWETSKSYITCLNNTFRQAFHDLTDFSGQNSRDTELSKRIKINPTARELRERGIRFEGQDELLPRFEPRWWWWTATVYLPQLAKIEDRTEECWRNLLAFEDAYYSRNKELKHKSFTRYLIWMDKLINDEKDVAVLMNQGDSGRSVIGSESVGDYKVKADLINSVTKEHIRIRDPNWDDVEEKINKFHRHKLLRYVGNCMTRYFSEAWIFLSTTGAIILLTFAGLQTVYTILGFYKRK